jgi:hypothetical protein
MSSSTTSSSYLRGKGLKYFGFFGLLAALGFHPAMQSG